MGFCERFSGFQNNFGFFTNAGYNQLGGSYPSVCYNPAICIDGSGYNYVGINTYKPAYNLDISGSFRTSNDIIYNNNSYSLISTINTISGVLYTHTNSINTLTTNTTKIFYVAGLNTTFIGRTSNTNPIDFSDGGLIMNNTSSLLGKNFGCTIYGGNGFFYNTNANRRTDFVNYTGYSAAANAATLGGFEFWIHNYNNPAYSIATLDYIGGLTISSIITNVITSNNNIASPILTANNINSNSFTSTYSTLPTFTSSQIGYIVSSSVASGATTTGSLQNLTSVSVNAGVYIVKWSFGLKASSGSTTLTYRIVGVNTVSTTLGNDYINSYTADALNTTTTTPTYQGTSFLSVSSASSNIYLVVNISPAVKTFNVYLSALRVA